MDQLLENQGKNLFHKVIIPNQLYLPIIYVLYFSIKLFRRNLWILWSYQSYALALQVFTKYFCMFFFVFCFFVFVFVLCLVCLFVFLLLFLTCLYILFLTVSYFIYFFVLFWLCCFLCFVCLLLLLFLFLFLFFVFVFCFVLFFLQFVSHSFYMSVFPKLVCAENLTLQCPVSISNRKNQTFTCSSSEGNPTPNIVWRLDGVSFTDNITNRNDKNGVKFDGIKRIETHTRRITRDDNGKTLDCRTTWMLKKTLNCNGLVRECQLNVLCKIFVFIFISVLY